MTESPSDTSAMENDKSKEKRDLDSFASQVRDIDPSTTSLDSLSTSLVNIFKSEAATLFVYDQSQKKLFKEIPGTQDPEPVPAQISYDNLAGYVAGTGKPINIQNVHSPEELFKYHKDLKYDESIDGHPDIKTRSAMFIPLPHKNKLTGVLEIHNRRDGKPFTDNDFIRAKAVSLVVGLAMHKMEARKWKNNKPGESRPDSEAKLNHLSHTIHTGHDSDELLSDIQQPLLETFGADHVIIYAVDHEREEIFSKNNWNKFSKELRLPIDPTTIAGFSAAKNRLLNIRNFNDAEELKQYHQDLQGKEIEDDNGNPKLQSLLTVPLIYSNKLMGILQLVKKPESDCFDPVDESNARMIAGTLAQKVHDLEMAIKKTNPGKFGYLVENGFLTDEEMTQIIRKSRESLLDVESLLIKDLYLRSLDVGKALESFYGTPYTGYDESIVLPNLEEFHIDYKILKDQFWVPLKKDDSGMVLLVNDPSDENILKRIKGIFPNQNIDIRVGLKMDIQKYFNTFYAEKENSESMKADDSTGETPLEIKQKFDFKKKLDFKMEDERTKIKPSEKSPAMNSCGDLFNEIISIAISQDVTDIHIEPGMDDKNLLVRLRKEGSCRVFEEIAARHQEDLIRHVKSLAHLDPAVNKLPQNGKLTWSLGSNKYELSVVIFPTIGNLEDAMIRISQIGKSVPNFKPMTEMDFSDPNLDKVMSRIHSPKGMVLIAGLEGAGKTTSLHALLGHLNTPDKKIVTAENPVEIVQGGLRQLQMNEENGLNYNLALQTFLLGNPDVIMVGEIENNATLNLCLEAAAQRLVFSSLKTKSTLDTLRKMRELNIDPAQLGEAFLLIVAQKLVPSLCPHCKEDYHPSQEEFNMLEKFYGDDNFSDLGFQYNENLTLKKAVGCKQCIFTGYSGQIALQEVLERTPELNRLLADNAPMEEIHNQAMKDGMITLNQDGIFKIMNGDCDFKKIQEAFLPGRF